MMAGAGQLDSPTCEVNASNSPRFDINEFLKTPKDAITAAEEQYFNFATFNLPGHNSTSTTAPTLRRSQPGAAPPAATAAAADQADFSTLLATINDGSGSNNVVDFDHHSSAVAGYPDHHVASDTLSAFDEIDADTLFSAGTHVHDCSSVFGNPLEPVPSYVPSPGHRLPYTWAYMVEDLPRPDDRACGESTLEHAASTSGGAHADWGMAGPTLQRPQHFDQTQQQQVLQCASCQILRRIIHSNGMQDTKLEIHGCDGQSYHAVLQTRFCIDDGFPSSFEQQMVEFPVGNAEYVKQFLLQYSLLRRKEGFVLEHDSVTSHGSGGLGMAMSSKRVTGGNSGCIPKQMGHMVLPDVLCTSSDFSNSGCAYGKARLGHNKIYNSGSIDSNSNADINVGPTKPPKSNAAAQRERTGKLKMMDLAQHFHLPINAAAKELGICPTVLKKICRRNGMRRWPHRKIKSIERIIATLEQTIAEGAGQGDEGIRMEIAMLQNERAQLCAGFLGES